MLAVIEHAVHAIFSFSNTLHQSTVHGACSTVQLLHCKTSFLRQKPGDERTIFTESYGIKNMSCKICKSEILKKNQAAIG